MKKRLITEFLDGPGSKSLYREIIQAQIRKLSKVKLYNAVGREISNLPQNLSDEVEGYILLTNLQLGHDKNFWKEADCHLAYELIIGIALQSFPLEDRIKSIEDSFKPENDELAFNLFQIPTLCFSYYASTQRELRKFWGIRKGLFG
jgi:hypothetical protein